MKKKIQLSADMHYFIFDKFKSESLKTLKVKVGGEQIEVQICDGQPLPKSWRIEERKTNVAGPKFLISKVGDEEDC